MKSTDAFKNVIEARLQEMAAADPLFAATLKKEGKNIDDCITYILNQVKKSGCNGFTDEEVFGMAAHYFDEDKIEVGNPLNSRVVVNHHSEPVKQEVAKSKEKPAKPEKKAAIVQPSLFD